MRLYSRNVIREYEVSDGRLRRRRVTGYELKRYLPML